ncbi:Sir2 family NAD-dependent protein deacetylase [Pseudomonas chlororaphis]|uniref:Sir2 family NAD-dependent protein deacetylase n=1 Tax=Pseudomonas chlororaphis TaxID=587753 RepID=UPI003BF60C59
MLKAPPQEAAHLAIAQLADGERQLTVIAQNIDDLCEHRLHGSLMIPKCFACHRPAEISTAEQRTPHEGALIEPRAVNAVMADCVPAWCDSAKTCPQRHGKPPRSRREATT